MWQRRVRGGGDGGGVSHVTSGISWRVKQASLFSPFDRRCKWLAPLLSEAPGSSQGAIYRLQRADNAVSGAGSRK